MSAMKRKHAIELLPDERLSAFLDRHRKSGPEESIVFEKVLQKIIGELYDIVPCENIYVLLDDPIQNFSQVSPRNLTYVAATGPQTDEVVGLKTVSNQGFIAQTYNFGSISVLKSDHNESIVLDKVHLPTPIKSAICNPIKVGTTIGVLVLKNKKDPVGFTIKDIRMVNILTGYLEMSIQNAMDTKKIHEQTIRDNLTGLYNDRYFHQQLEVEVRKSSQSKAPLSLVFMDLDHFKDINDQYGHLIGSQTLKEVSFVIREHMETPGALLARYGGDEYVIILPNIHLNQALEMAEKVRSGIHTKMFMIQDATDDQSMITFKGVMSASIGVASLHDHIPISAKASQRKNLFIQRADKAMYKAKALGKNQVCAADPIAPE